MPQIKVADDVITVDEYDRVRIDLDMAAKTQIVVGILSLGYGLYTDNIYLLSLFAVVIVSFAVTVFVMDSIRVLIRHNGAWKEVGKYKFSLANYAKKQLIGELK